MSSISSFSADTIAMAKSDDVFAAQNHSKMKVLRLADVLSLLNVHEATLTRWISAGAFPQPIQLAPRTRAWYVSEVEAWFAAKNAARNSTNAA